MRDKFALGYCFNSKELFLNFPLKKLQMTQELCNKTYSDGRKRDLAASIFVRSVELVVDDIIENNTHFKFPTIGKTQAYLKMNRTVGDDFKTAFKNGKWRDIDFMKSNFSGYLLALVMESLKRTTREKLVYISKNKKNKLTEYTNAGKLY